MRTNGGGGLQLQSDSLGNQTGAVGALASGVRYPLTRPIRTILCAGDSITALASALGLDFGVTVNVTGLGGAGVHVYAIPDTPAGNGTLTYTRATNTLSWAEPGDTAGAPVVAVDGVYRLYTGTTGRYLTVPVTVRDLPTSDKTDTLASGLRYWRRLSGGWIGAADALTFGRFIWQPNLGIGGNRASDIYARRAAILNSGADFLSLEVGTNDIVAAGLTPAVAVANIMLIVDAWLATGRQCAVHTISPRGDVIASVNTTMQIARKLLEVAVRQRPGAHLLDFWANIVDTASAIGAPKTGYTTDNVHDASAAAYERAKTLVRVLDSLTGGSRTAQNVGTATLYNASTNTGGNLLSSNTGAFVGTGGTAGTGAVVVPAWAATTVQAANTFVIASGNLYVTIAGGTTGTAAPTHTSGEFLDGTVQWRFLNSGASVGLAAGWTVSRSTGSAMIIAASKCAATDGGPAWQQFTCIGAAVDFEAGRIFPTAPSNGNFTVGIETASSFEVAVSGQGCAGVTAENLLTISAPAYSWDCFMFQNMPQGFRDGEQFKMLWENIIWPSGVTGVQPRATFTSLAGAIFSIRFRNWDLHKVTAS